LLIVKKRKDYINQLWTIPATWQK